MRTLLPVLVFASLLASLATADDSRGRGQPWRKHTIDDAARGADGVRLADVNGDGHLDIATGWEEAGIVRLYLNPGPAQAKERWPAVTVGKVKSPEDAVPVDLDADGSFEIVSCCEGGTKSVFVHWNTNPKRQRGEEDANLRLRVGQASDWTTEPFPALAGKRLAMFCLPMQIDGENGIDLIVGSKGKDADIGWLRSPKDPRNLAAWTWHPLTKAGWIMSLVPHDMDGDGDDDVLVSDRKRESRGVYWLERPEPKDATEPWPAHLVRGVEGQVMFLDVVGTLRVPSAAEDGTRSVPTTLVIPTHDNRLWLARGKDGGGDAWDVKELPWPANIGNGKSAAFADIDLDGQRDIVISCETREQVSGIVWLSFGKSGQVENLPHVREISGTSPKGLKCDRVELIDLDADGDQDVLTTEERSLWGVVWFENPVKQVPPAGQN